MTIKMKPVDVVLTGVGWTGGILGKELAQAGLKVVGLERGHARDTNPDFLAPWVHDELRYHSRFELMQDLAKETLTFRNSADQVALPMRYLGSFYPGERSDAQEEPHEAADPDADSQHVEPLHAHVEPTQAARRAGMSGHDVHQHGGSG